MVAFRPLLVGGGGGPGAGAGGGGEGGVPYPIGVIPTPPQFGSPLPIRVGPVLPGQSVFTPPNVQNIPQFNPGEVPVLVVPQVPNPGGVGPGPQGGVGPGPQGGGGPGGVVISPQPRDFGFQENTFGSGFLQGLYTSDFGVEFKPAVEVATLGNRLGREVTQFVQRQFKPAQTLDTTTPCPSCDRIPQIRAQLQKSIDDEQQQQQQKQLQKIINQLKQLQQQEQQDPQTRNIPQEIQQKQELMKQLDQLQQGQPVQQIPQLPSPAQPYNPTQTISRQPQPQAGPQPQQPQQLEPQTPGPQGTAPIIPENPPVQLQPQAQQPQLPTSPSSQPQAQQPGQQGVTFCVGCQSEEDAILFLNGETSACAVIPGSTKPLQIGA